MAAVPEAMAPLEAGSGSEEPPGAASKAVAAAQGADLLVKQVAAVAMAAEIRVADCENSKSHQREPAPITSACLGLAACSGRLPCH